MGCIPDGGYVQSCHWQCCRHQVWLHDWHVSSFCTLVQQHEEANGEGSCQQSILTSGMYQCQGVKVLIDKVSDIKVRPMPRQNNPETLLCVATNGTLAAM